MKHILQMMDDIWQGDCVDGISNVCEALCRSDGCKMQGLRKRWGCNRNGKWKVLPCSYNYITKSLTSLLWLNHPSTGIFRRKMGIILSYGMVLCIRVKSYTCKTAKHHQCGRLIDGKSTMHGKGQKYDISLQICGKCSVLEGFGWNLMHSIRIRRRLFVTRT